MVVVDQGGSQVVRLAFRRGDEDLRYELGVDSQRERGGGGLRDDYVADGVVVRLVREQGRQVAGRHDVGVQNALMMQGKMKDVLQLGGI